MYTTLIEADELATHLEDESWVVLDARFSLADTEQGRQSYATSRIPGARYAHLDEHLSGNLIPGKTGRHPMPDRVSLANQFAAWGINNHSQIIVYDDKVGAVAARLWWLSKWLGHDRCAVLNGGFADWTSRGKPVDETEIDPSASPARTDSSSQVTFTTSKPLLQIIDIDQAATGRWQLIDAREATRYAGVHEPIDPVAGHIKGALNQPFMQNIDDKGRFLPTETLHSRLEILSEQKLGKPIAHYCGSGVTAAHNVLAMVHAGLEPGALYAGSFSEWITRDSNTHPIGTDTV